VDPRAVLDTVVKRTENEIQLLTCPFSSDTEKDPDDLQLELIHLEQGNKLREVQFC